MLLQGAMPEVELEIELEVGCVGGWLYWRLHSGCTRGCAEGVCAEGVQRLCGGYAEMSVDGGMSACFMLEDV